ncbi:MAG: alpha/beta hydrolase [Clostridia bacterium]|nr:alpha/beta hydrolase [Clostridia bacterium]
MKKIHKFLLILISISILCCAAVGIYASDYYRADAIAVSAGASADGVSVIHDTDGEAVFMPQNPECGLIFYPGGKVEYKAYAPLMKALAEEGVLCVVTEMPLNLAVLDVDAADGIAERYPDIKSWFIGGHSLGGSMAASYALDHADALDGLVLLASYSTADLSVTDLRVISVYGSNDGVLNMEKYEEYKSNLPENTVETVIDGGCHAYFGSYGAQEGDGTPTITADRQIAQTVTALKEFIKGE